MSFLLPVMRLGRAKVPFRSIIQIMWGIVRFWETANKALGEILSQSGAFPQKTTADWKKFWRRAALSCSMIYDCFGGISGNYKDLKQTRSWSSSIISRLCLPEGAARKATPISSIPIRMNVSRFIARAAARLSRSMIL